MKDLIEIHVYLTEPVSAEEAEKYGAQLVSLMKRGASPVVRNIYVADVRGEDG